MHFDYCTLFYVSYKSLSKYVSHCSSQVVAASSQYTAFDEYTDTLCCYFDFQQTSVVPRKKQQLIIDLLVSRIPQQMKQEYEGRISDFQDIPSNLSIPSVQPCNVLRQDSRKIDLIIEIDKKYMTLLPSTTNFQPRFFTYQRHMEKGNCWIHCHTRWFASQFTRPR